MYKDVKHTGWFTVIAAVLALFGVLLAYTSFRTSVPEEMEEESIASIRRAVQQSALQCYVIEGVYPSDLAYLQENYGLRINTDAYIIASDAYAENQLPSVKVVKRNR